MRVLRLLACLALVLFLAGTTRAQDEDAPPRARRTAPHAAATPRPDAFLRQLADSQRALGAEMQQLKEQLDTIHAELSAHQDAQAATDQEVKALRDEVKGLYVESSALKQQIDALKDDVAGVNSNVSGFRTFSGFFLAVMIVALVLILVLSIRR